MVLVVLGQDGGNRTIIFMCLTHFTGPGDAAFVTLFYF